VVPGANSFAPRKIVNKQQTNLEEQMKFNKWTLGLAAVGAISLASAARADEQKLVPLNTAVSSTVISGVVDVGAQYNPGNYSTSAGLPDGTSSGKVDNFSLNQLIISLDKPLDETPWASGYHVDLNWGSDSVNFGSSPVRQAYVTLRTPVGNGLDWKVGVQDDIIGYEGNTLSANPNYTRSYGYDVEPTTLVGALATYKVSDVVTVQAAIANATSGFNLYNAYNNTSYGSASDKTIAGAVAFTAPDSFGFLKGATLNLGTLLNIDKGGQDNYYAGVTIPTPLSALKFGAAFDLVSDNNAGPGNSQNDSGWIVGLYGSYQATAKLSFNVRGEYFDLEGRPLGTPIGSQGAYPGTDGKGEELTATIAYNLWANVITRAEVRWDHIDQGEAFSNESGNADAFTLALNIAYTF
jgi:hypothetical protein